MASNGVLIMTCKDCKHFQKTQIKYSDGQPLYDCPYANDWCEEDDEINTLCDDMFEPKPI